MSLRLATKLDLAGIERLLARHVETSMFLRSNLAAHGLGPGTHRHATTCWVTEDSGGITGVFGATTSGYLILQAPEVTAKDLHDWVSALAGREVLGLTGEAGQVQAAFEVLGWREDQMSLNHAEPLYVRALEDLQSEDLLLRRALAEDEPVLTQWFATYLQETGWGGSDSQRLKQARERAVEAQTPDSTTRILMKGGVSVAMAALNAEVEDVVQVGGVFVPAGHRNHGHGRRVTTALLVEARQRGIRRAVLFANNTAAARAYEGIGFERVGSYGVALLNDPVTVVHSSNREAIA